MWASHVLSPVGVLDEALSSLGNKYDMLKVDLTPVREDFKKRLPFIIYDFKLNMVVSTDLSLDCDGQGNHSID